MTTDPEPPAIVLPWSFDTTSVWHIVIKGAFGLTALLTVGLVVKVLMRRWLDAAALTVFAGAVASFTTILVRHQDGSRGTIFPDRLVTEPNLVLGVPLPGPHGTYQLHQFSGVRIEFRPGPITTDPNAVGPHELLWLLGHPGTPNILVARTRNGAGRAVGAQLGAALGLSVTETGAPLTIRL